VRKDWHFWTKQVRRMSGPSSCEIGMNSNTLSRLLL
jgi:hypothetical protein